MAGAVYYRTEDYAGIWLRLLIDVLDFLAAAGLCAAATVPSWGRLSALQVFLIWAGMFFAYFVLVKWARIGTLGYRIAGVRVIGSDGNGAGLASLVTRFLCIVLGPLNYTIDLAFFPSDPQRQTLRDKFARTYVVKRNARPAGTGKVVRRSRVLAGFHFHFREIEPDPLPPR